MFKKFYELSDYGKQQAFLRTLIRPQLIKRRRHGTYDHPQNSRRQRTFAYYLPLPGSEIRVCLKTFAETFRITVRRVEVLRGKIMDGEMSVSDQRGGKRDIMNGKSKEEWKVKIREHIGSIPTVESHYSRNHAPNRQYLPQELNVTRLYRSFLEKYCSDSNQPPVSRQWYHEVFLTDFNLTFAKPRVDTCSTCDELHIRVKAAESEVLKRATLNERKIHQMKATAATNEMANDAAQAKVSNDTCVISYDMQQQMYLPHLTHSEMYYCRQLACCNLGIHVSDDDTATMCFWSEDVGGRGANEVATSVHKFLTQELHSKKENLIVWSDNCCGQNKNKMIIAMYMVLVAKNQFKVVTHKFLVKGHTYLSCDRDFGIIEKRKRRVQPMIPMDLVAMIASCKLDKSFTIMVMDKFFDWKQFAEKHLNTTKLKITKASQIQISAKDFGMVGVRQGTGSLQSWNYFSILKPGVTVTDFQNVNIDVGSSLKGGLSQEKKNDIQKMLPYLTPEHRQFYEELLKK